MKNTGFYTSSKGDLDTTIQNALDNLKWKYEKKDNTYTVKFSINLYTLKSTMKIHLLNENQCDIEIVANYQLFDWGFGQEKINNLIRQIQILENE